MQFFLAILLILTNLLAIQSELFCENDSVLPTTYARLNGIEKRQFNTNEDLIDITSEIFDQANSVDLTVIYRISSKTIKNVADLYKYLITNVNYINFELIYYENNLRRGYNCRLSVNEIENSTRILTFPARFPRKLKSYTTYKITSGYVLKSGASFNKGVQIVETCFGAPDKPESFKSRTLNKNCDVELSWLAPNVINAPKLCYYYLKVTSKYGTEIVSKNVYDEKYVLNNLQAGEKYNVVIEAINDISCYLDISNRQCFPNRFGSGYVTATIECNGNEEKESGKGKESGSTQTKATSLLVGFVLASFIVLKKL